MPYKNPEHKRQWEREHREQRNARRRMQRSDEGSTAHFAKINARPANCTAQCLKASARPGFKSETKNCPSTKNARDVYFRFYQNASAWDVYKRQWLPDDDDSEEASEITQIPVFVLVGQPG